MEKLPTLAKIQTSKYYAAKNVIKENVTKCKVNGKDLYNVVGRLKVRC